MTEFRSGVKWDEWGEVSFLEVDELGELISGNCVAPKFLDWKLDQMDASGLDIAWCFKPRRNRTYWKTYEEGVFPQLNFEERLVCGHKVECDGQEAFDV